MGCPALIKRASFGNKDILVRGVRHEDREKAGTAAERFVRWVGAGFSWKFRTG